MWGDPQRPETLSPNSQEKNKKPFPKALGAAGPQAPRGGRYLQPQTGPAALQSYCFSSTKMAATAQSPAPRSSLPVPPAIGLYRKRARGLGSLRGAVARAPGFVAVASRRGWGWAEPNRGRSFPLRLGRWTGDQRRFWSARRLRANRSTVGFPGDGWVNQPSWFALQNWELGHTGKWMDRTGCK